MSEDRIIPDTGRAIAMDIASDSGLEEALPHDLNIDGTTVLLHEANLPHWASTPTRLAALRCHIQVNAHARSWPRIMSGTEAECEGLEPPLTVEEKQAEGMRGAYECLVRTLINATYQNRRDRRTRFQP